MPQVFDLWQDPQERYDIFMNNYTERTWTLVTINAAIKELMKTYVKYPPRKLQSEAYTGPITIHSTSGSRCSGINLPEAAFRYRHAYRQLNVAEGTAPDSGRSAFCCQDT